MKALNCNKEISVITVYTNLEKLAQANRWLEEQTVYPNTDIVQLDNREQRFTSCAQALNYGAEHACGDYLVFMHQDLYLWDLEALEKCVAFLKKNPDAIIGVAGVPRGEGTVTDIYESEDFLERGTRAQGQIREVDSLDECFFAMTREKWQQLRFDEATCDDWHGYAVDICFQNTLRGGKNILVPLKVCHDSKGNAQTASFRASVKKLVKKYHGTAISRIHGTCIDIPCTWPGFYWYNLKGNIKEAMRRLGLLR